ncbi:MAG: hypothetical protein ACSW8G_03660 [Bacillota bacterium]
MNYYELIDYLDIGNGSELQYFEEMADLIESDEHIEHEALLKLFEEADFGVAASLIDEYFEDMTSGIPSEYTDIFSLLDQIRMELTGLIRNASADDPDSIRTFTNRFYRFRNWYVYDTEVSVLDRSGDEEGREREFIQSVRDAIATARAGKLSGDEFAFDFSQAMDYDIDFYAMSVADLMGSVEEGDNLN